MSNTNNRPRYHAFTKIERKSKKPHWISIGAAFAIQDGKGLSVKLNALPIDGQIMLFTPKNTGDASNATDPS